MTPAEPHILVLNGGSSSIRFGVYRRAAVPERLLHGKLDRIGQRTPLLTFTAKGGQLDERPCADAVNPASAAASLLDWLDAQPGAGMDSLTAVGHRVVHGASHAGPAFVTPALLTELRGACGLDPEHLPGELALIDAVRLRAPALPQVVCFDTVFHRDMPRVAQLMAIPRRFTEQGVRRHGYHGLSYAYLMEELARRAGPAAAQGRVVLAHLGNGASMAAVRGGHSIDTTMGFTPASGLPMGTRSGDIDPGLALYLERTEQMTLQQFDHMLHHESGLLGVSQTSADMRDLLSREAMDPRAADAVALFCYQAKKAVGALAAALGGLDTLVFAGGIGESAAPVRARICQGLGFLGIALDEGRNAANAPLISVDAGGVAVHVIPSDEELMIARSVCRVVGQARDTEKAPA